MEGRHQGAGQQGEHLGGEGQLVLVVSTMVLVSEALVLVVSTGGVGVVGIGVVEWYCWHLQSQSVHPQHVQGWNLLGAPW
jgi:hypothetical protein